MLGLALPAVVGRGSESQAARDFAPVAKASPADSSFTNTQPLPTPICCFRVGVGAEPISGAFVLIAMLLVVAALWDAAESVINRGDAVDALLNAVGLIVIAMAATDVGKYLFDEEVVRS